MKVFACVIGIRIDDVGAVGNGRFGVDAAGVGGAIGFAQDLFF